MTKMRQRKRARKLTNLLGTALAASMAWSVAASAADCPRKGTLGTSRILGVDAATTPRVGLKNFPQTLPLEDHEVVLTFDDGPCGLLRHRGFWRRWPGNACWRHSS